MKPSVIKQNVNDWKNIQRLISFYSSFFSLFIFNVLYCRRGSVIITFSVDFDAVDSEQVVKLTDSMENEGLLSALGSVTLVNITADRGNVPWHRFQIDDQRRAGQRHQMVADILTLYDFIT